MKQDKMQELEKIILRDYGNIAGMMVLKNGKTLYDGYFNGCTAASRCHVYSVTKSIISILIGIAMDKGYIKNVEQKVLDFFPDYPVKKGRRRYRLLRLTCWEAGDRFYKSNRTVCIRFRSRKLVSASGNHG